VAIPDWPEGERPREKLLERGAPSLSHAELLAVFLRTGVRGKSAVDLGRDLIRQFGSLGALFAAPDREIAALSGIGPAKCAQLRAAYELARRALERDALGQEALSSPKAVRTYLQYTLSHRPHEVFAAVWLDAQHRVLEFQELFAGTLTQTSVYTVEGLGNAVRDVMHRSGIWANALRVPRVHDFRHAFAVAALRRWYEEGRDVQSELPKLSMYMGHVSIASTTYYLRFMPAVVALASQRFASSCAGLIEGGAA